MFKYEDFLNLGKNAEFQLANKLKRFVESTQEEDLKGVDLSLTLTFDVKKAKKIRREDMAPSYSKTWIEYRNVRGEYGSICRETLDFFLIETVDSWVVKSRLDALELFKTKSKVSDSEYKTLLTLTPDSNVELYQPYQRAGRKDVIMLVEINCPIWETKLSIPKNLIQ